MQAYRIRYKLSKRSRIYLYSLDLRKLCVGSRDIRQSLSIKLLLGYILLEFLEFTAFKIERESCSCSLLQAHKR
jgi:hypothetical protein